MLEEESNPYAQHVRVYNWGWGDLILRASTGKRTGWIVTGPGQHSVAESHAEKGMSLRKKQHEGRQF